VTVTFTPPSSGVQTGTLAISSDDPKHPSLSLVLKGVGK
jgi:hypothetical protein